MKKQNPNPTRIYRRSLPHIQPNDGVFFITYNLNGSLPKEKLILLREQRDFEIKEWKDSGLNEDEIKKKVSKSREWYFGRYDQLLDDAIGGPKYLKIPEVAEEVAKSIHWMHNNQVYKLIGYTIMSNHVHKIIYKTKKNIVGINEKS